MTETAERALTAQQRHWLEHLRACESSGKTMRAYAAEAGISIGSLYGAKKRLVRDGLIDSGRQASPVKFTRTRIVAATAPIAEWRVGFPNGITVSFSGTVNGATLTTVLRAAATLS